MTIASGPVSELPISGSEEIFSATLAVTEAGDGVSASGVVAVAGTAAIAEDGDTAASTGAVAVTGSASITEAGDTPAASGAVAITGAANITEDGDSVSATSSGAVTGSASINEDGDTVVATGSLGELPVTSRLGSGRDRQRHFGEPDDNANDDYHIPALQIEAMRMEAFYKRQQEAQAALAAERLRIRQEEELLLLCA